MKLLYLDSKILENVIILKLNCNKIIRNLEKFQVKLCPILIKNEIYIPIKIMDILYVKNRYLSDKELKLDKNNKFLEISIKNNTIKVDDKEIKEKLKEEKGEKYLNLEIFEFIGEKVFFYKDLIIISDKNNILDLKQDRLYIQLLKEELENKDVNNNIFIKNKKEIDNLNNIIENGNIFTNIEEIFKKENNLFINVDYLKDIKLNNDEIKVYFGLNNKKEVEIINIKTNNENILLKINNKDYEINGQKKVLSVEPFNSNGYIYIPFEVLYLISSINNQKQIKFFNSSKYLVILTNKDINLNLDENYLKELEYNLFEKLSTRNVIIESYKQVGFLNKPIINYKGMIIKDIELKNFIEYKLIKQINYDIRKIDRKDIINHRLVNKSEYEQMKVKYYDNEIGAIVPMKWIFEFKEKRIEVCCYITESINDSKNLITNNSGVAYIEKLENINIGDSIIAYYNKYYLIFTRNNVVVEIYPLYSEKQEYTIEKLKEVYFEILKNLAIEIDKILNNNLEYIF